MHPSTENVELDPQKNLLLRGGITKVLEIWHTGRTT